MMPKLLAFHLPQYHEIPENNEWWGEGFTDWVNVKKAKPLFNGHEQPRVPLMENYYDMSDVDTIKWQCDLAREYGVYGFCYYHYWFNGKKLLQKPVEILLEHKNIQTNYCICWANETWARTWDGKEKSILIQQDYGDKNDWITHIEYLMQFFNDDRYIKIDGHPIFPIYKTANISCISEMIRVWNEYLLSRELQEIWIIEMLTGIQTEPVLKESKAAIDFEPAITGKINSINYPQKARRIRLVRKMKNLPLPKCVRKYFLVREDYARTCETIVSRTRNVGKELFLGAFVGWDNTPRKGIGGTIYVNDDIVNFKYLLSGQYEKAKRMNSRFVFVNAWNEWAEGTYLEPDTKNKYAYLEAVKEVFGIEEDRE